MSDDSKFEPVEWSYSEEPAALLPPVPDRPEKWTSEEMQAMLMDCMRRYYVAEMLIAQVEKQLREFRNTPGAEKLECELFGHTKADQSNVAYLDKKARELQKIVSRAADPRGCVGPSNKQFQVAKAQWDQGNRGLAYGVVCEQPRSHKDFAGRYHTGCGNCSSCQELEARIQKM